MPKTQKETFCNDKRWSRISPKRGWAGTMIYCPRLAGLAYLSTFSSVGACMAFFDKDLIISTKKFDCSEFFWINTNTHKEKYHLTTTELLSWFICQYYCVCLRAATGSCCHVLWRELRLTRMLSNLLQSVTASYRRHLAWLRNHHLQTLLITGCGDLRTLSSFEENGNNFQ